MGAETPMTGKHGRAASTLAALQEWVELDLCKCKHSLHDLTPTLCPTRTHDSRYNVQCSGGLLRNVRCERLHAVWVAEQTRGWWWEAIRLLHDRRTDQRRRCPLCGHLALCAMRLIIAPRSRCVITTIALLDTESDYCRGTLKSCDSL